MGAARFRPAPVGTPEHLATVAVAVADPGAVLARARRHGVPIEGDGFRLAGVRLQPVAR